jgi:ribosomal protein L11 methyltransferase
VVPYGPSLFVGPRWELFSDAPSARVCAATPSIRAVAASRPIPIHLVPGPGFGDGTHPTTQVCLQAIAALAPRESDWRLLDFGSGSGILSVAGALLRATVDAVELDPRAVEHAGQNLRRNGVSERVRQVAALSEATGPFDLVVANILRSVLLAYGPALVSLRSSSGALVLSGLVSTDVPEVSARYSELLGGTRPEVYERDEWRALVWRGRGPRGRVPNGPGGELEGSVRPRHRLRCRSIGLVQDYRDAGAAA